MAKKHRKRNQAKKDYNRKPKKKKKQKDLQTQANRMWRAWEEYDDEVFEKMFEEWEAKEDAEDE